MHCGVDSQRVIWILLVVLTVVGGVAAVGVATNERRKSLAGGGGQKQLTTGDGDKLLERTVRYPPEAIVVGDVRFALDKRGTATCTLKGDVGPLGVGTKDRPEGHTERCRWWLYSAPGEDTMLVEQWGSDYRVLRGKKVGDATIELMPGS